jgi:2-keto-4-pentenoate hydratase/2-oxohepta-3-ene-1,7-dioic acid hydratase in catechol pathway
LGIQTARFRYQDRIQWGVVKGEKLYPLSSGGETLQHFLAHGTLEAKQISASTEDRPFIPLDEVELLNPITRPAQIVCQGTNYGTHRTETGLESQRPPFNLIFTKADSSLQDPGKDVVIPDSVQLLDYEIELGLVIGKAITEPKNFADLDSLYPYVAGLVIANDVSARDVQLPQHQWYKGKSYRTFCPAGPYLYLLDPNEMHYIGDLELRLWVNGELRQQASTKDLLYKPAETLTELSQIIDLHPGDVVLTGTPGGVALQLTPEIGGKVQGISHPYPERLEMLVESQQKYGYLKEGDRMKLTIASADGVIDLGTLENGISRVSG